MLIEWLCNPFIPTRVNMSDFWQSFALKKLDDIVDEFWAEIADHIEALETLYEDQGFPERRLAALVTSKVYYHLGSFPDSLHYALGAEDLFDVNDASEYVRTIISKCIDYYINKRNGIEEERPMRGSSQVIYENDKSNI